VRPAVEKKSPLPDNVTYGGFARDQPKPYPSIFLINTLQQHIYQSNNTFDLIILSMDKAIPKCKAIEKAVLAYNNDPSLSYRRVATIHDVAPNSVINRCSKKITFVLDIFITNQKLSPVEEAVLIKHSVKCYN
jgi:hypothetical protein